MRKPAIALGAEHGLDDVRDLRRRRHWAGYGGACEHTQELTGTGEALIVPVIGAAGPHLKRRAQEAQGAFGAFGIPPEPEQVVSRVAGQDPEGGRHGGARLRSPQAHLLPRLRGQHPGVLADRPGLVGDEARAAVGGGAREAAGHRHIAVRTRHQEAAQRRLAGQDPRIDPGRAGRGVQDLLPDIGKGTGTDAVRPGVAFACAQQRSEHRPAPELPVDGFDHEIAKAREHMAPPARLPAPPGHHRGQIQVLAEKVAGDARQEAVEPRVLKDAAAKRVGDGHVAAPHRLEEPRDPEA